MAYIINDRYVRIHEDELRGTRYLSRIRIIESQMSCTQLGYEFIVDRGEYEYLIEQERRNNMLYNQQYVWGGASTCTQGVYNGTYSSKQEEPKKKEAKVSKQIRHQFLRRRLLERVK